MNINNFGIATSSQSKNISHILRKKYGQKIAHKILKSTGPKTIKFSNQNEDIINLALKAWKNLKKKTKFENLIFVSQSYRYKFPANSYVFLKEANIKCVKKVFDINSACTGFIDALEIANNLTGNSLIITSETYNKNLKKFNRSVSTLFSDAASAFIFEKKKYNIKFYSNIFPEKYTLLMCEKNKDIIMDGPGLFQFVKKDVAKELKKLIINSKKKFNLIFIHQASKLVLNFFKEFLKIEDIKIPENIVKRGNTVSSTIPILIHDTLKNKKIKLQKFILCGFGVGISYKIALVEYK